MTENELKINISTEKEEKNPVEDNFVDTEGSINIGNQKIEYTTRTGTLVIGEEEDKKGLKQKATIFFVAYTKKGEDPANRPITFTYNGGPGSSSVWLHMGLYGPYRCIAEENETPVKPPYKFVENEYALLDISDFVFIDPVSTGFSRPTKGEKADQFHGITKDIETVGEFIRLYTTKFGRWSSPKFISGESYGTTRSAGLSGYLQDKYGMYLNGILLISSILNFQTARFFEGNDLPFILFLPTFTATAWYHNQLPDDLQQRDLPDVLREVEEFAASEYTLALIQGDKIAGNHRAEIIQQLSRYTGLTENYVDATDLRINIHKFTKQLRRGEKRTVGRLDSRYIGIDRDASNAQYEYDPSYTAIQGPYTATFNDYVKRVLNYTNELPYEILANLYENWDYSKYQNQYVNVAETLRSAMTKNQSLKVIVANGYYDLATPYFATQYTFSHLGLDPTLRNNYSMTYYRAGHMMYLHEGSLKQLSDDLREFYKSAL